MLKWCATIPSCGAFQEPSSPLARGSSRAFIVPPSAGARRSYSSSWVSAHLRSVSGSIVALTGAPLSVGAAVNAQEGVSFEMLGSFLVGCIVGGVAVVWAQVMFFGKVMSNLRQGDAGAEGTTMVEAGGVTMPGSLILPLREFYDSMTDGVKEAEIQFSRSGQFGDLSSVVEERLLTNARLALQSVKRYFPTSMMRTVLFNQLDGILESNSQVLTATYATASKFLGPDSGFGDESSFNSVYEELWALDEGRCSVSGRVRLAGTSKTDGKRGSFGDASLMFSLEWEDPGASVLVDVQGEAPFDLDHPGEMPPDAAPRPLFAYVAPQILARPTSLALTKLFDVFTRPESCLQAEEVSDIVRDFLSNIVRTPVMRCAYRHIQEYLQVQMSAEEWLETLERIWFSRRQPGDPCGFQHVFMGELDSVDDTGRCVVGGLHNWLKYYLEEVRGVAKYTGYVHRRSPEDGVRNARFVSGKFSLTLKSGKRVLKDAGSFFVGTSPEFQIASGTVAYFETVGPSQAEASGWKVWEAARQTGYYRDVVHDGVEYRRYLVRDGDVLLTVFAGFQGLARKASSKLEREMDQPRTKEEMLSELSTALAKFGLLPVKADSGRYEPEVGLMELVCKIALRSGAKTFREAAVTLMEVLSYPTTIAGAEAQKPGSFKVAQTLCACFEDGQMTPEAWRAHKALDRIAVATAEKPNANAKLVRILLTGRPSGGDLADVLTLLELWDKSTASSTPRASVDSTGLDLEPIRHAESSLKSGLRRFVPLAARIETLKQALAESDATNSEALVPSKDLG